VVELDVRDDREPGRSSNRAVGLVALDDEPARARAGVAAELRDDAADDPRGSSPVSRSAKAIIAAVVVLPCAPVTTIDGARGDELGEEAARGVPSIRSRWAVETIASKPVRRAGLTAEIDLDPVERLAEDRLLRVPAATSAPQRAATFAYADIPSRRSRRSRAGGPRAARVVTSSRAALASATSSSATPPPRRAGEREHRLAHRGERARVGEELVDERRARGRPRVRDDDRAAAALEVARVERLVVGGRVRVRTRIDGTPAAASSQTVPPRARRRRRPPRAPRRSGRSAAAGRSRRARRGPQRVEVALAEMWSTAGPRRPRRRPPAR
jgi:hypothetical protein